VSVHYQARDRKFICPMCGKPIDLDKDEITDEDGQVIHAECYFKRVGGQERTPPASHHPE
jgi:hypothetical protein